MSKGFYVPDSLSHQYVAGQRNSAGEYKWNSATDSIGLMYQQNLQAINKQYGVTINNAYHNYMSAKNSLGGSNMGAGYKDAYLSMMQENLIAQRADANLTAANARAEMANAYQQQMNDISRAYTTEVEQMDRVGFAAEKYLSYLKTLEAPVEAPKDLTKKEEKAAKKAAKEGKTPEPAKNYLDYIYDNLKDDDKRKKLTREQFQELSLDKLYDVIFEGKDQAINFTTAEGDKGKPFMVWLRDNMQDTERDKQWSQWLFGLGGYEEFKKAAMKKFADG